jgi:hypothetical protein
VPVSTDWPGASGAVVVLVDVGRGGAVVGVVAPAATEEARSWCRLVTTTSPMASAVRRRTTMSSPKTTARRAFLPPGGPSTAGSVGSPR